MLLQEEERYVKPLIPKAYLLKITWAAMNQLQRRNVLVAWAGIKQEDKKDTLINDHLAAIEAQHIQIEISSKSRRRIRDYYKKSKYNSSR